MNRKNYFQWHSLKTFINNEKERPNFHEREIWFCSLGCNVGFEQDGRGKDCLRPVLVLRKFNKQICLIIPLSRNNKKGIHYFQFSYIRDLASTAILSQVRLIDSKRFKYLDGYISKGDFGSLKEKLKRLIA